MKNETRALNNSVYAWPLADAERTAILRHLLPTKHNPPLTRAGK